MTFAGLNRTSSPQQPTLQRQTPASTPTHVGATPPLPGTPAATATSNSPTNGPGFAALGTARASGPRCRKALQQLTHNVATSAGRLGHRVLKRTVKPGIGPRRASTSSGIERDLRRQFVALLKAPGKNSIAKQMSMSRLRSIMTRVTWLDEAGVIGTPMSTMATGQTPRQTYLRRVMSEVVKTFSDSHLAAVVSGNPLPNPLDRNAPAVPAQFANGLHNMMFESFKQISVECASAELRRREQSRELGNAGHLADIPTVPNTTPERHIPIDTDAAPSATGTISGRSPPDARPSSPHSAPEPMAGTRLESDVVFDDGSETSDIDTASFTTDTLTSDGTSTIRDTESEALTSQISEEHTAQSSQWSDFVATVKTDKTEKRRALSDKSQRALNQFSVALHDYFDLAAYVLTPSWIDDGRLEDDHDTIMAKMELCLRSLSNTLASAQSGTSAAQRDEIAEQISRMVAQYAQALPPSTFASLLAASQFSNPGFHQDGVTPRTLNMARSNEPMAWHSVITAEFAKSAHLVPDKLAAALADLPASHAPEPGSGAPAGTASERASVMRAFSRAARQWPHLDWGWMPQSTVAHLADALEARGDDEFRVFQETVARVMHLPQHHWVDQASMLVEAHLEKQHAAREERDIQAPVTSESSPTTAAVNAPSANDTLVSGTPWPSPVNQPDAGDRA